jgi:hypothetical protein
MWRAHRHRRTLLTLGIGLLATTLVGAEDVCTTNSFQFRIGMVKNNPFTADVETIFPEASPDGGVNQTGRRLTYRIARNSAGQVSVRSPQLWAPGKSSGAGDDPQFWFTTICDPDAKTTTSVSQGLRSTMAKDSVTGEDVLTSLAMNGKARIMTSGASPGIWPVHGSTFDQPDVQPATKTSNLGYRTIEGMRAFGYRWWTPKNGVIDEGTYTDKWVSEDLQSDVSRVETNLQEKHEYSLTLTHLQRVEPDPTLFEIPAGYKVIDEEGKTHIATRELAH